VNDAGRDLNEFFATWRPRIESELDRVLPPAADEPCRLHEAMRYAIFGGGKRLRPICVLLGADAVGADPAQALVAAAAMELIHTYSLVHDDLPCMDDDDLRRGRKTVHRAYDEATAVLVGDALLTEAFEAVARDLPPRIAAGVVVELARGAGSRGMVGGQMGDIEAEGARLTPEGVRTIDLRKTAALFAASFASGALCGGAEASQVAALAAIGRDLGLAFQIVDDLLDLEATPETLGKSTGKDAARGKATLPALVGAAAARSEAARSSAAARTAAAGLRRGRLIEALIESMLARSS
jgi:geranylgeranyl pyrophosphate synthase